MARVFNASLVARARHGHGQFISPVGPVTYFQHSEHEEDRVSLAYVYNTHLYSGGVMQSPLFCGSLNGRTMLTKSCNIEGTNCDSRKKLFSL